MDPLNKESNFNKMSRLLQIQNLIENFKRRKHNFIVIKKGKKRNNSFQYILKDGFINYIIDFKSKDLCQCSNKVDFYCDHVLYIMIYDFGLSNLSISLLKVPKIFKIFIEDLEQNKQKIGKSFQDKLKTFLNDECCGICLFELNASKFNNQYYICEKCHNIVHLKCMEQWITYKSKENPEIIKKCIYCKN